MGSNNDYEVETVGDMGCIVVGIMMLGLHDECSGIKDVGLSRVYVVAAKVIWCTFILVDVGLKKLSLKG